MRIGLLDYLTLIFAFIPSGFAGADNLSAAKADALCDQYSDFVAAYGPWHFVNAGYFKGDAVMMMK